MDGDSKEKLLDAYKVNNLNIDWLTRDQNISKSKKESGKVNVSNKVAKLCIPVENSIAQPNADKMDVKLNSQQFLTHNISRTVGHIKQRRNSEFNFNAICKNDEVDCHKSSPLLRRTKSLSDGYLINNYADQKKDKKSGSFFKSLFSRKKNKDVNLRNTHADTDSGLNSNPISRRNSILTALVPTHIGNNQRNLGNLKAKNGESDSKYSVKLETEEHVDPKLLEFINNYKLNGLSDYTDKENTRSSNSLPHISSSSTIDLSLDGALHNFKLDHNGVPLPSHPNKSSLPSALKHTSSNMQSSVYQNMSPDLGNSNSPVSSKFGAFLKRVTSHTDESNYKPNYTSQADHLYDSVSVGLTQSNNLMNAVRLSESIIPGLESLKPLKHVAFSTNVYSTDPPQQICSRNPRKGEVEVSLDGSIIIHRLTPEEKREILQRSSCGIVVGGLGQFKIVKDQPTPTMKTDCSKENIHTNNIQTDELNKKLDTDDVNSSNIVKNLSTNSSSELLSDNIDNTRYNTTNIPAKLFTIDKPMVSRREIQSTSPASLSTATDDLQEIVSDTTCQIPYDILYTRCCHLREILPIPSTLKQLKSSSDPISLLQLRNPRPSMVEVLSFSDFLSIATVLCVSLDGVSLSVNMLRIILSSLIHKGDFEKLTLRNTPIDDEGWKILCLFVSKSKSLRSLDLTMVPSIHTNVQKPSKSSLNSTIIRMECNLDNRSKMNWALLSAAIAVNGKIEELILSGAKIPSNQFKDTFDIISKSINRLGIAYNDLTKEQCEQISNSLIKSTITGIDVGYNDLHEKIKPFADVIVTKIKKNENIFKYISLNNTNLQIPENGYSSNNEVIGLLNTLCYCKNLKFLDLSNNPKIFPGATNALTAILPVFANLVRLHLDYNNLTHSTIISLAEVIPLCPSLNYVSILGTKLDLSSSTALAIAAKKSTTLFTLDFDDNTIPDKIKERISLYTMRNVEREFYKFKDRNDLHHTSHTEKIIGLQDELSELLTENVTNKVDYENLIRNFLAKVHIVRSRLKAVIEGLFKLRIKGELSIEGKETLIRFCFIDASFEKGLKLLSEKYYRGTSDSMETVTSNMFPHVSSQNIISTSTPSTNISPSTISDSSIAVLLPFNQSLDISSDPADDTVEIKGTDCSNTNDVKYQLKEEGNVLRKTLGLLKGLQDSASSHGTYLDHDMLKRLSENYNGEEIKNFILGSDVSKIIGILDDLKNNGIELNNVFKKKSDNSHDQVVDIQHVNLNLDSNTLETESVMDSDSEEIIDRTYDEVLDTLERKMTNVE